MSTPTMTTPELYLDEDDTQIPEPFDRPSEPDFNMEEGAADERQRYDHQILAGLVFP